MTDNSPHYNTLRTGDGQSPLPWPITILSCCFPEEHLRPMFQKGLAPLYTFFVLVFGLGAVIIAFFDKHWTMVFGFVFAGCSAILGFFLALVSSHRSDTLELKVDHGFANMDRKVDIGFAKMVSAMNDINVTLATINNRLAGVESQVLEAPGGGAPNLQPGGEVV